ncbi:MULTISPECIES: DUF6404 family protein [unclassified Rhodosalinus]|uniref:DUF6404 family protein n=1 Tax=unclassified Rhodosalinus TaxID=2630183 RepID=UPI0035249A05
MKSTEPTPNRHEKLRRALAHLERGGVKGAHAYAPAFRSLARAGYILRPLHYWSFLGLTALGFFMLVVLIGGTVTVCLTMGFVPRPVHRVVSAGPVVFLGVSVALALVFAAAHKIKARSIRLPKWQDL